MMIGIIMAPFAFDLGDYEDDKDYCDTYEVVGLVDEDYNVVEYEMEDFYNSKSMKDFTCAVVFNKYKYMFIKTKCDLDVNTLAMYVHGDNILATDFVISFYKDKLDDYNKIFADIKSDPKHDDSAITSKPIGEDVEISVQRSKWVDFLIKLKVKDVCTSIKAGECILLKFQNNAPQKQPENLLAQQEEPEEPEKQLQNVMFQMTNVLISIDRKGE